MLARVVYLIAVIAGAGVVLAQGIVFPELTGRVVDDAEVLSASQERTLTDWLERHEDDTTNQVVVVTVPSLQGLEIEDYGYQLGRHWGIGQADHDNGVLLIVAPEERKVRIEVGYGLEGALTDAESRMIIDYYLLPAFRAGHFGDGIEEAVPVILAEIGDEDFGDRALDQLGFTFLDWLMLLGIALVFLAPFIFMLRQLSSTGTVPPNHGARDMREHRIRHQNFGSGGGGSFRSGGFRGGGGGFGGGGASGSW